MRKKLSTYALAGAVGLTAVAGAAVLAPAVSYAATGDSTALDSRVSSIKDALKGLVSDGTITQSQADKVASTLAEARPFGGRFGGFGGRVDLAAAAEALGITEDELRTAAEAGKSLADLAEENGVSEDDLVSALVTAMKERLAEAVSAGRLTQAQADELSAEAPSRIAARLDAPIRHRGGHHGGFRGRPGEPSEAPSAEPTTTPGNDA